MYRAALKEPAKKYDPACDDLMTMAEQELTAFFRAVNELFGLERAQLLAEDWLNELLAAKDLPASRREWRLLTMKASARLKAEAALVSI
jgi:hypothetical protein